MINALEIPADVDLSRLTVYLRARGVPHRITEQGANQVVWTPDERTAELVQAVFADFQAGDLPDVVQVERAQKVGLAQRLFNAAWRYPVTILLIVVSVVLYPAAMGLDSGEPGELLRWLMFLGSETIGGSWYWKSFAATYGAGEVWRLFTPMFVHFGWLHIVFNMLWVWELGRRIEVVHNSWALLAIALVTSVGANVTQFIMAGASMFGGMSGVVFGLLGHALVWSRLRPDRSMGVPSGIYIFMLAYLAIGFTGAIDLLGLGSLANGAHLGGLLAGFTTAGLAVLLTRKHSLHQDSR